MKIQHHDNMSHIYNQSKTNSSELPMERPFVSSDTVLYSKREDTQIQFSHSDFPIQSIFRKLVELTTKESIPKHYLSHVRVMNILENNTVIIDDDHMYNLKNQILQDSVAQSNQGSLIDKNSSNVLHLLRKEFFQ